MLPGGVERQKISLACDTSPGRASFQCSPSFVVANSHGHPLTIADALAASALRRDGGTGHDFASEPHRLSWRILAPASMIEISGSRKRGVVKSALSRAIMASPAFAVSCWHATASGFFFQILMHR
jgi:hypothetical protein